MLPEYLAAYGTLKQEFGRWPQLGLNKCKVVGTATAKGRLYSLGAFPALIEGEEDVEVEVIKLVGDLPHIHSILDYYEGVAVGLYSKKEVTLMVNDTPTLCAAYYFQAPLPPYAERINNFNVKRA